MPTGPITPEPDPPADAAAWVLVVVPEPGLVPSAVRVRRWLKSGLRSFGLRCVHVGTREPDVLVIPTPKRKPRRPAAPGGE